MYFIKKGKKVVPTTDPNEVTPDSFVVEPGGESRIYIKLEKYKFHEDTGEKIAVFNQINAVNPGDFDNFVSQWKKDGIKLTMLYDPRPSLPMSGTDAKLAILNERMKAEEKAAKEETKESK
jgi:hypothetical protein